MVQALSVSSTKAGSPSTRDSLRPSSSAESARTTGAAVRATVSARRGSARASSRCCEVTRAVTKGSESWLIQRESRGTAKHRQPAREPQRQRRPRRRPRGRLVFDPRGLRDLFRKIFFVLQRGAASVAREPFRNAPACAQRGPEQCSLIVKLILHSNFEVWRLAGSLTLRIRVGIVVRDVALQPFQRREPMAAKKAAKKGMKKGAKKSAAKKKKGKK